MHLGTLIPMATKVQMLESGCQPLHKRLAAVQYAKDRAKINARWEMVGEAEI